MSSEDDTNAVPLALGEERVDPEEAAVTESMLALIERALERQYPVGVRPFRRDAHPKLHGLVRAEFTVLPNLPQEYRHGLFARPQTYGAWIRFSAATGPIASDERPDAQGMAIKLLGVAGEKLASGVDPKTQDFVLVNYPTFHASNVREFLSMLGPQKAAFLEEHPLQAAADRAVYTQHVANPLQIRYWSMTPYKLGAGAMKYSARRVDSPLDGRPVRPTADFLREAMVDELSRSDVTFDFMVQLQRDAVAMPIEDALALWSESLSPFVRVATIRIPRQSFDSQAQRDYGDDLSFSPWNGLLDHRPLGGINRARGRIYAAISELRHARNGVEPTEPAVLATFD